ncbi:MAG: hypothetical protein NXI13_16470 [Proteobacteria bacterium]|nr:hypothetical protein [Pseudomonadota bacterium]
MKKLIALAGAFALTACATFFDLPLREQLVIACDKGAAAREALVKPLVAGEFSADTRVRLKAASDTLYDICTNKELITDPTLGNAVGLVKPAAETLVKAVAELEKS